MEYDGKTKSPYYGIGLSSIMLVAAPIIMYFFFYFIFKNDATLNDKEVIYSSLFFGCGVAWIFQFTCVLAGLMKGTFKVVVERIKELFENLQISFKFAMKHYWENIKSEGVVFWIYFIIINLTLSLAIYGGLKYYVNVFS